MTVCVLSLFLTLCPSYFLKHIQKVATLSFVFTLLCIDRALGQFLEAHVVGPTQLAFLYEVCYFLHAK